MPYWLFLLLVITAWLVYPVAGAAQVAMLVADGKRPAGAGFSFLPELIVFPACFFMVAAALDWIAMPLGRVSVGLLSAIMIGSGIWTILRSYSVLPRTRKE